MAQTETHIPLEEFAGNARSLVERAIREGVSLVVENDRGAQVIIKPVSTKRKRGKKITEADYQAFLASAGGWKDVDTEQLKTDIYADRRRSLQRPPLDRANLR